MKDLFEKEEQVIIRSKEFMQSLENRVPEDVCKEFEFLTGEYAQMLRQLRWVTRISDLTAQGLNTDKKALLSKVNIDALTEIYNRRFLMNNLSNCLDTLETTDSWITVLMLDIDFFKKFNDTYGHPAGDVCLKKIANTLHNSLSGAQDFVVRYGGEEFIMVLPGADKDRGLFMAQRILDNIFELNIPHESSSISDRITISIGLVSAIPKGTHKMQQYISQADAALYQSKKKGRNQVTYFEFEEDLL